MFPVVFHRTVTSLLCVALVAGPLPARAEETIRCDSPGLRYRYCRVDTDDRVELVRQHSFIDCRQDRNWGYDRYGVWVDRGCSADFRVGRDRHSGRDKAAVAGVALVGLAALLALSANKQAQAQAETQPQAAGEVAPWAVGSFSGYDSLERTEVQLTILPGGAVTGRAGRNEFTGSLKDGRLTAGRHLFRVAASGNGFIATDERDSSHQVVFQRSGSGY